jgi:hypothetical protein
MGFGPPGATSGQDELPDHGSMTPQAIVCNDHVAPSSGSTTSTVFITSPSENEPPPKDNTSNDTSNAAEADGDVSTWWPPIWTAIRNRLNSPWVKIVTTLASLLVLLEWFLHPIRKFHKWWKHRNTISYDRYYNQLSKNFGEYENYPDLELERVSPPPSNEDTTDKDRSLTLSEAAKLGDDLHILGRPGSGKTSMLKKHTLILCSKESGSWWSEPNKIPIYIEYRGKSLFEQIISRLNSYELSKDPSRIENNWLRNELREGKFIILIDDAHIFLSDEDKKRESDILDLLEYDNNTFVIAGRDYYPHSPVSRMKRFEIQDLTDNDEKAQQILRIHTDETKAEQAWRHIRYGLDRNSRKRGDLRELYSTPQSLMLLGRSFNPDDPPQDNESFLFNRFFKYRHNEEKKRNPNSTQRQDLKKKILGYVAFRAFVEKAQIPYSLPHDDFRGWLVDGVRKVRKELGYDASVDTIEEGLWREGYLVRYENTVKFEHDQWQEFFAALEIRSESLSIAKLFPGNPAREVARFVSGFYLPENRRCNRNFWKDFWREIIGVDFFLFEECLNSPGFVSRKDFLEAFDEFKFTDEDLHSAYLELADCYARIIQHHFPNLANQFAPNSTDREVGVLVEQKNDGIDFWYGYRPVGPDEERVLFVDQSEMVDKNNVDRPLGNITYYKQEFDVSYWHALHSTPVHDPPVVMAFRDVRKQISDFVRKGELQETSTMRQEAIYNVAVALSKRLTGRGTPSTSVTDRFVLPVSELLSGLQQLKNRRFRRKIDVPGATYHFHDLPDRELTVEDVESQLRRYIRDYDLQPTDKITTPNADLLEVINRYRWRDDEISSSDREFLIRRSAKFYRELYVNYKSVLESSFPTSIKSFHTYFGFPIQVFLVRKDSDNRRYFGEHRVYFNVDQLSGWGSVDIVDGDEAQEVKELDGRHEYLMQPWRFDSFSRVEPIRSAVYRLIQREYET